MGKTRGRGFQELGLEAKTHKNHLAACFAQYETMLDRVFKLRLLKLGRGAQGETWQRS